MPFWLKVRSFRDLKAIPAGSKSSLFSSPPRGGHGISADGPYPRGGGCQRGGSGSSAEPKGPSARSPSSEAEVGSEARTSDSRLVPWLRLVDQGDEH